VNYQIISNFMLGISKFPEKYRKWGLSSQVKIYENITKDNHLILKLCLRFRSYNLKK